MCHELKKTNVRIILDYGRLTIRSSLPCYFKNAYFLHSAIILLPDVALIYLICMYLIFKALFLRIQCVNEFSEKY